MCEAIVDRAPVAPSALNPTVSPELQRIIAKALEKDRDLRYQRASEMRADLEALTLTPTIAADAPAHHWRTRIVVASALAAIAVVAAGVGVRLRRPPPLTERDTIVVADFVNATGDSVFDGALKQGLSVKLLQSPFLNVLPERKLGETLELMRRAASEPLTAALARDVCVRTNSRVMLSGTISRLGTQYVLGLRAQECHSGADVAREQVEVARKEEVLKALDTVTARVRQTLGESLSTLAKYDAPVAQATTSSLEALQAYSAAWDSFLANGDAAALVLLKRAVELDPKFALAYTEIGVRYENLNQLELARESFEKAYAQRDRASERERYGIMADYFMYVTGEEERANLIFDQWARAYPRASRPLLGLSLNAMSWGHWQEALAKTQERIRVDPEGFNFINLIYIDLALNRPADAKAEYEQAIARQPNHSRLNVTRYVIASYDDYFGLWKDADRNVPILKAAQAEYARLR